MWGGSYCNHPGEGVYLQGHWGFNADANDYANADADAYSYDDADTDCYQGHCKNAVVSRKLPPNYQP